MEVETRRYYAFAALQIAICGALLWFMFTQPGVWDWQRILGIVLMLAGLAGIATARFQLGRSFAVKAEAHRLITHGLYSKIRNPIYVFGTVLIAGFVVFIRRPMGWVFLLIVTALQIIRAHREAQVLETAFGDAYREYRRKTWF
jgi:protein-S-isoprenylcysteine O-methyltransferase Ste14